MMHVLKKYIHSKKLPIKKICNDLGITNPHLYYIINRKRYPSRDLCLKIYDYTNGEVTPMELLDIETKKEGIKND